MAKVLFYLDRRSRGGAQRVMTELCSYFAENGLVTSGQGSGAADCEVVLACQLEPPEQAYPISDSVREVILPVPSRNRLKRQADRIRALMRLCEEEKPDIIISFLIGTNIIAIRVGMSLGIPVLISVRNDPARDGSRLSRHLIKKYYPKASGCVFQTKEAMEYFGFEYPTAVIMNPLSGEILRYLEEGTTALPSVLRAATFPASGDGKKGPGFISVGRLEPQKRHDITLEAFAEAVREYPDISLRIFGQGPQLSDLTLQAELLGISDRVEFAGITDDILTELLDSDAFVMSSDYEGMPNALMEAMAAGLPCISTDCPCGGPASLILDGENGYLFPVGDTKALAEKMVYIIEHASDAKNAGKKAADIRDRCRIDNIAREWAQIITECQKKKP